jgi:outer membrane beta-barrel protein
MEIRLQHLFLNTLLTGGLLASLLLSPPTRAEDPLGRIVTPDMERRTFKEAKLDNENFEFGVFYGILSIEDFGSNDVMGATFAYHITESFFVEAAYGQSKAQKTSYELLSGAVELLTDEERKYRYYNLSLGYNLLPGQIYIRDKWAFNTNFYLMGGAGNTTFAAQDYFTYNLGAGLRFYAVDWVALDLSMRNHSFSHELLGEKKTVNNLEARFGITLFF